VGVGMMPPKGADDRCGEDDVADQTQANEQDSHCRSRFSVLTARFVFWFVFWFMFSFVFWFMFEPS
jgi:hypothetical protein